MCMCAFPCNNAHTFPYQRVAGVFPDMVCKGEWKSCCVFSRLTYVLTQSLTPSHTHTHIFWSLFSKEGWSGCHHFTCVCVCTLHHIGTLRTALRRNNEWLGDLPVRLCIWECVQNVEIIFRVSVNDSSGNWSNEYIEPRRCRSHDITYTH